jgi:hypothetical protein
MRKGERLRHFLADDHFAQPNPSRLLTSESDTKLFFGSHHLDLLGTLHLIVLKLVEGPLGEIPLVSLVHGDCSLDLLTSHTQ